jgi:hypothetical protein
VRLGCGDAGGHSVGDARAVHNLEGALVEVTLDICDADARPPQ